MISIDFHGFADRSRKPRQPLRTLLSTEMRLFFALLFISRVLCSLAVNYEIDLDGSTTVSSHSTEDEVLVEVGNACGAAISVWWGLPTDENSFMFDLSQSGKTALNTFHGHHFFAKFVGEETGVLGNFTADGSLDTFTFCSDDHDESNKINQDVSSDKLDSPVKIMGSRSFSLTARFRCLYSGGVDYYYDDGGEGSYQGSLLMGSEVSTNSYEGHTFFFTEKGNKGKEIQRVLLTKDTVRMHTNEFPHFMWV